MNNLVIFLKKINFLLFYLFILAYTHFFLFKTVMHEGHAIEWCLGGNKLYIKKMNLNEQIV